jgi:hypothetical protein
VTPYVVIGITSLIALAGWGIWAGISALAVAWCVSMIIAHLGMWFSGGFLPRKVRKETAEIFIQDYSETVTTAYPGLGRDALQKSIEGDIERICKTAARSASAGQTGLEQDLVLLAVERLAKDETGNAREELINALGHHLESTWYKRA